MKAKTLISAVAMFTAIAAHAAPTGQPADYGQAASPDEAVARTVEITAGTHYVNVVNGETVRFKVGDDSFAWHVNTYPNLNAFELGKIAPSGVPLPKVLVYVAANDTYVD
jgi:hypothetical protein